MLKKIRQMLENRLETATLEADDVITGQVQTAAAALLIELTKADLISDELEWESLKSLLLANFNLDQSELQELLADAKLSVNDSTDLYQYTRLINAHYDYDAKCLLMEAMWKIARADGRVDRYEEHFIRKIQGLIHVAHSDFIRTKQSSRMQ